MMICWLIVERVLVQNTGPDLYRYKYERLLEKVNIPVSADPCSGTKIVAWHSDGDQVSVGKQQGDFIVSHDIYSSCYLTCH